MQNLFKHATIHWLVKMHRQNFTLRFYEDQRHRKIISTHSGSTKSQDWMEENFQNNGTSCLFLNPDSVSCCYIDLLIRGKPSNYDTAFFWIVCTVCIDVIHECFRERSFLFIPLKCVNSKEAELKNRTNSLSSQNTLYNQFFTNLEMSSSVDLGSIN